jgi:hypothetical protein
MHEISTEIKITKEEIDTFLAAIFGESNEFNLEKVTARVSSNFILLKKVNLIFMIFFHNLLI